MTLVEPPRLYPSFRYRDAPAMIDWLAEAFGFAVHVRFDSADGSVGHAELSRGSSMIMLGSVREDAFGRMVGAPGETGGKSTYVAADDIDALCARARAAGAAILEGPVDRDYGSREFTCADPEGNVWTFGTYWPKAHDPV
ncbi:MAG: VOC family protein [Rhizobiaceae bacterium]|nr:VOC family protein [Rhizobiaceae bacterium]